MGPVAEMGCGGSEDGQDEVVVVHGGDEEKPEEPTVEEKVVDPRIQLHVFVGLNLKINVLCDEKKDTVGTVINNVNGILADFDAWPEKGNKVKELTTGWACHHGLALHSADPIEGVEGETDENEKVITTFAELRDAGRLNFVGIVHDAEDQLVDGYGHADFAEVQDMGAGTPGKVTFTQWDDEEYWKAEHRSIIDMQ